MFAFLRETTCNFDQFHRHEMGGQKGWAVIVFSLSGTSKIDFINNPKDYAEIRSTLCRVLSAALHLVQNRKTDFEGLIAKVQPQHLIPSTA